MSRLRFNLTKNYTEKTYNQIQIWTENCIEEKASKYEV